MTPTKTVKTENGPISRGSQSEVFMVRDLWRKRFTKKVSFEWKSEGVMDARHPLGSVIFVNENENENGEKRENNEFVNEN